MMQYIKTVHCSMWMLSLYVMNACLTGEHLAPFVLRDTVMTDYLIYIAKWEGLVKEELTHLKVSERVWEVAG